MRNFRKRFTFAPTNGDVSGVTATLGAGDANNDNSVDIADFGLLVGAYGSLASDPTSGCDVRALLDAFRTLPSRPRIFLCLLTPAFQTTFGINNAVIINEEIPILRQVAYETGTELIDLHTAFLGKQAWFPDNIHPNVEGAAYIAKVVGDIIDLLHKSLAQFVP